LLAKDEILVSVVSPGSIASESLVGRATSVGVDGTDPYRLMEAIAEHFGIPLICPGRAPRTKWVRWWHFWRHVATRA
jgi:hypothetical protein